MITSLLSHPITTFVAGAVISLAVTGIFLSSCAPPNRSAEVVADYRREMAKAGKFGPAPGTAAEKAAIDRFTIFLQSIGSKDYILKNTSKTYSADAYLNDTLVVRHGSPEIEKYFLKTNESLKDYKVTIDDVVRSDHDYYVRWTMTLTAPALGKGEPVHSVGISQVRFAPDGKVAFHQDFWDAGDNFFGKLPVAGGVISFIRKRLQ